MWLLILNAGLLIVTICCFCGNTVLLLIDLVVLSLVIWLGYNRWLLYRHNLRMIPLCIQSRWEELRALKVSGLPPHQSRNQVQEKLKLIREIWREFLDRDTPKERKQYLAGIMLGIVALLMMLLCH